jgi:hypothetical protein
MLSQELEVKIPLTTSFCPPDLPFVFTQVLLDSITGRVVKVDVLVCASMNSEPYLEELEKCNKSGIDCRAFAVCGLSGDSAEQKYFYLTFAFQAGVELEGVYVCVPSDDAGNNRGTVSVPDSIGNP